MPAATFRSFADNALQPPSQTPQVLQRCLPICARMAVADAPDRSSAALFSPLALGDLQLAHRCSNALRLEASSGDILRISPNVHAYVQAGREV